MHLIRISLAVPRKRATHLISPSFVASMFARDRPSLPHLDEIGLERLEHQIRRGARKLQLIQVHDLLKLSGPFCATARTRTSNVLLEEPPDTLATAGSISVFFIVTGHGARLESSPKTMPSLSETRSRLGIIVARGS